MKTLKLTIFTFALFSLTSNAYSELSCDDAKNELIKFQGLQDQSTLVKGTEEIKLAELKKLRDQKIAELMLWQGIDANFKNFQASLGNLKDEGEDAASLKSVISNANQLETGLASLKSSSDKHITDIQNIELVYDLVNELTPEKLRSLVFSVSHNQLDDPSDKDIASMTSDDFYNAIELNCKVAPEEKFCQTMLQLVTNEDDSTAQEHRKNTIRGFLEVLKNIEGIDKIFTANENISTESANTTLTSYQAAVKKLVPANLFNNEGELIRYSEKDHPFKKFSNQLQEIDTAQANFTKCSFEKAALNVANDCTKPEDVEKKIDSTLATLDDYSKQNAIDQKELQLLNANYDALKAGLSGAKELFSSEFLGEKLREQLTKELNPEADLSAILNTDGILKSIAERLRTDKSHAGLEALLSQNFQKLVNEIGCDVKASPSLFDISKPNEPLPLAGSEFKKEMVDCLIKLQGSDTQNKFQQQGANLSAELLVLQNEIKLIKDSNVFQEQEMLKIAILRNLEKTCKEDESMKRINNACSPMGDALPIDMDELVIPMGDVFNYISISTDKLNAPEITSEDDLTDPPVDPNDPLVEEEVVVDPNEPVLAAQPDTDPEAGPEEVPSPGPADDPTASDPILTTDSPAPTDDTKLTDAEIRQTNYDRKRVKRNSNTGKNFNWKSYADGSKVYQRKTPFVVMAATSVAKTLPAWSTFYQKYWATKGMIPIMEAQAQYGITAAYHNQQIADYYDQQNLQNIAAFGGYGLGSNGFGYNGFTQSI